MTDGPIIGLRRPPDLEPGPDPGSEPGLLADIESEIRSRGPMTFARFMDLALYHPRHGYYASGRGTPGRQADFLTAPEAHPLFGWAMARQLEEAWDRLGRPPTFTVRELGAGRGGLAAGVVEGLARERSALLGALRYRVVEMGPDRSDAVEASLAGIAADGVFEPDDGAPIVGAVLANEVVDALPVHRVEGRATGGIVELYVGLDDDGRLVTLAGPPSTRRLAERLAAEGIDLEPGQRVEVCLALDDWIARTAAGLERGLAILIDYGHPAAQLYDPARGSLLRAYVRHRVHDDPYANIGRQDLTAHVDLTAVERAATAAGLDHHGTASQAAFLAGLDAGGLLVALQAESGTTIESYLEARAALVRMLDPAAMGRFAVMVFGRGLPAGPPLRGLAAPSVREPGAARGPLG